MHNIKITGGLLTLIILIFLFTGCKKDKTVDPPPVKDPRTYTWTADTLWYPGHSQILMTDIWGSSPNDVYVVGHSSATDGVMWHYDGNKWTDVKLAVEKGGQIEGAFDLTSIYGFNSTDIYAVGERIIGYNPNPPPTFLDSSLIIHYDGIAWKQVKIINGNPLRTIQGGSTYNIWAGGRDNTLYNYDGTEWKKDSVIIDLPQNQSFHIESINVGSEGSYMLGYISFSDMSDQVYYFLKRINSNWTKLDSSNHTNFGAKLFRSLSGTLYSVGRGGVYKYQDAIWKNMYNITSSYISGIWGTSDNNLFIVGNAFGVVYHYNGTDWKRIDKFYDQEKDYKAVWTDGTEAFIIGHIFDGTYMKTIVWHGK